MAVDSFVSLRIIGELDIDQLSEQLGIQPSDSHKAGEKDMIGRPYEDDMWTFTIKKPKRNALEKQLEMLVDTLRSKYGTLEEIKSNAKVDVFCAVTSYQQDGLSLSPKALSIFHDLQIKMEVSLILFDEE